MDRLELALDNLALAATNDKAVVEQLTAANLALTSTITMLTATNKKLVDKVGAATLRGNSASAGPQITRNPVPGNYCWTHGHRCSKDHMSVTCGNKAPGHKEEATSLNTMGGSEKDKGWDKPRT
jgi:hypothetical protein